LFVILSGFENITEKEKEGNNKFGKTSFLEMVL